MKRNRQAMPPCLSMLSQRLWKLLETTNNNSESQFVWWCFGHGDGVVRSQANPYVPLLPGSFMRPVDGNTVQLPAVPVFRWILPMNLPATISSVQCPVLSHKNVVASEASNSRLVIFYFWWSLAHTPQWHHLLVSANSARTYGYITHMLARYIKI